MTSDEQPIRISPERVQKIRERMKAASMENDCSASSVDVDPYTLPDIVGSMFEARQEARAVIHEHVAYELPHRSEWQLAISVLSMPFDHPDHNFEDELGNSMVGLDYILECEGQL